MNDVRQTYMAKKDAKQDLLAEITAALGTSRNDKNKRLK